MCVPGQIIPVDDVVEQYNYFEKFSSAHGNSEKSTFVWILRLQYKRNS